MRWVVIAGLIVVAGCAGNDSPLARAAGSWPGLFHFESPQATELKGNLELYATGKKFLLDMKTEHQAFTVKGKWSAAKNRVTMIADNFIFKNPKEEDQKALNLHLIAPDDIRSTFGHAIVLDETPDKRRLVGLRTSMGKLIGEFQFERPIPR